MEIGIFVNTIYEMELGYANVSSVSHTAAFSIFPISIFACYVHSSILKSAPSVHFKIHRLLICSQ